MFIDLSGKRFGRLLVLHREDGNRRGSVLWSCLCDCGTKITKSANGLKAAGVKSCGCFVRDHAAEVASLGLAVKDLSGKKFGRLEVIGRAENKRRKSGRSLVFWICRCLCGEIISIQSSYLLSGNKISCGCLARRELHGDTRSPEYEAWACMKIRVLNPNRESSKRYNALDLEPDWERSYSAFLRDVGRKPSPGHSLDRKNNSLGYLRGNVRWATRKEQNNNTSQNVFVEINGVTKTVAQWAEFSGENVNTLYGRARRGAPLLSSA